MLQLRSVMVTSRPRHETAYRRRVTSALARERARLRGHFREVLAELRTRDVHELSAAQRIVRRGQIAELERYAAAGVFPQNRDSPGRPRPQFVDASGTRCAMAHLIATSGNGELVARIARTANDAYIRDLADDVELQTWLAWAGLSVAEAGRIQPSYCFVTRADECFCRDVGAEGVLEVTVEDDMTVKVDAVHGDGGAVKVGDLVMVSSDLEAGDAALVQVFAGPDGPLYGGLTRVGADGVVEQSCMEDVPPLQREDAIAALLTGDPEGCATYLKERVDADWGKSICELGGCGCATQDADGASLGGLLLLTAWWVRRRGRARRRLGSRARKPA